MKRFLALAAICAANLATAQDVHFSQFYETTMLRNPALTGVFTSDYKVSLNYRNQWSGFATPFKTGMISGETKALLPSTGDFVGFGLTAVFDKAGAIDFSSTSAYASVNYAKALGLDRRQYLSFGLCGGYMQRSINPSRMQFSNQFTGGSFNAANANRENINNVTLYHFDVSAGLSMSGMTHNGGRYYAGISGYHISKPKETYWNESFIRLTTRWNASAGYLLPLGDNAALAMHLNYTVQSPYKEAIGGGLLSYRFMSNVKEDEPKSVIFSAGCFYRLNDAIIPTVKLDYRPWAVTLSYDIAMSKDRVNMDGVGGWELTASVRGNYRHKVSRMDCPPGGDPLNTTNF